MRFDELNLSELLTWEPEESCFEEIIVQLQNIDSVENIIRKFELACQLHDLIIKSIQIS